MEGKEEQKQRKEEGVEEEEIVPMASTTTTTFTPGAHEEYITTVAQDMAQMVLSSPQAVQRKLWDVDETVDAILSRCDELSATLEAVHKDVGIRSDVILPRLVSDAKQLERIFEFIQFLEALVAAVQHATDRMEDILSGFERFYGKPGLLALVSGVLGRKPTTREPPTVPAWDFIVNAANFVKDFRDQKEGAGESVEEKERSPSP